LEIIKVHFLIIFILIFVLILSIRSIEYKGSIKKLEKEIKSLKEANRNLSQIIQEDKDE